MIKKIASNHAEQWSGSFAEKQASAKRVEQLEKDFPELFTQALAEYNKMLSGK